MSKIAHDYFFDFSEFKNKKNDSSSTTKEIIWLFADNLISLMIDKVCRFSLILKTWLFWTLERFNMELLIFRKWVQIGQSQIQVLTPRLCIQFVYELFLRRLVFGTYIEVREAQKRTFGYLEKHFYFLNTYLYEICGQSQYRME